MTKKVKTVKTSVENLRQVMDISQHFQFDDDIKHKGLAFINTTIRQINEYVNNLKLVLAFAKRNNYTISVKSMQFVKSDNIHIRSDFKINHDVKKLTNENSHPDIFKGFDDEEELGKILERDFSGDSNVQFNASTLHIYVDGGYEFNLTKSGKKHFQYKH